MPFYTLRRMIFAAALAMIGPVQGAVCVSYPSQGAPQTVSFGTIEVRADTAPGTLLAERSTTGWTSSGYNCIKPNRTGALGTYTTPSALGNNIYETNVPGVGVRVYSAGRYGDTPIPYALVVPGVFNGQLINEHFRVQLIKTGPMTQGGWLRPGLLAQAGYDGRRQVWVDLLDAHVEPQRPTCAFTSRRLLFALDKVDGSKLLVAGSSHWVTQQLVSTGCVNANQILMTFTGRADETDPSLFKLLGKDAATGVAVELRSDEPDEQAIPNSPTALVLQAAKAGKVYGFRARYRTTGKPLAPGTANTNITVNVAYR